MQHPTFMEGYVLGDLHEDDIDGWIAYWHDRFEYSDVTLYEYLGMTPVEYGNWIAKRRTIKQIVQDRDVKKPSIFVRVFDGVFWWIIHRLMP